VAADAADKGAVLERAARRGQKDYAMPRNFEQNQPEQTPEPSASPEVRYILMGSIICAILVLIGLSVLATP
jgi:hypothetical protein